MESEVRTALDRFRSGDEEDAFFELLDIPGDLLPVLIDVFRTEPNVAIRALLVRVAWERRDHLALAFLGEALNDLQEEIWQQALDGLVAFALPESLEILQRARTREGEDDTAARLFQLWLEEAIGQVEFELRRQL
ncbi:MAG: hypothetical protein WD688_09470 [Candidatus Binatia bacterium]